MDKAAVLVAGDNMHGKHHAEVLIMTRDADGPGWSGNYYNSLGVPDDLPDEEFDARFRALDPAQLQCRRDGRTRTLEQELVMRAIYDSDPPNTIVLDVFENNYQRIANP